jgi:hypothetical protein
MGVLDKVKRIFHKAEKESRVVRAKEGKDKTYSSSKTFSNNELARMAFLQSKKKLFDVNRWSEIPNPLSAGFKIYDQNGYPSKVYQLQKGDFIKIDLPGPFPDNWVKVITIKDTENLAEFIVMPSENPTNKDSKTSHFFHKGATSTFRTKLSGNTISAYEIGKNEVVNVKDREAGKRKILNVAIAEGGWAGFQKLQWKNLTKFLVMDGL